jgi:hypothetical protein
MKILLAAIAVTTLAAQSPGSPFAAALAGAWSGTLEYRDYRSDRRVTLPTQLKVSGGESGRLEFAYTYDDGPGKTVTSRDRISIDAAAGTYRIQNDENYDATFIVTGLQAYSPSSPQVVLMGTGTENDKPVELRITITVTTTALTMLRESRLPGEDWRFRNQYRLTR